MGKKSQQATSSKLEQMIDYRRYLMHLLPYCEPDCMSQIKAEIAFVDSFIAQTCRSKSLILVVEDEPVRAKTLVAILRSSGYEAFAIHDPGDAVALCADLRPDLAVVDVILGKVNGIELAVGLCQSVPSTRLLLMSGYLEANDCAAVFEQRPGRMTFLERPISPQELLASIKDLLARPDVTPQHLASRPPTAA
ncbi:MAG TPA: response regulator [Candidatus Bathyarchaeia archaeon]|nr:response regulator [Candidatus Bathyarchaeia archaeon]